MVAKGSAAVAIADNPQTDFPADGILKYVSQWDVVTPSGDVVIQIN